ncbi:MAG TPA: cell division protein FtsA [Dysgonamonadaceae bacterium]|nr:cell division protein FtsA [Dysgonamonadaceae bacterium]
MIESGFIAAIDLGTSKITGIVARKNDDNVISVLACETTKSGNSIRRGLVYNIKETNANVRKVISKLENKLITNNLGGKIAKVYVSVAGQSLHTVQHTVSKQLSSTGIVTDNVIEQMHKEAKDFKPDMSELYNIADVEYIINGKAESKPVGVTAEAIDANYQMIVGRPNIVTNIDKSIKENVGLEIAGYVVGPLASANIALDEDEKELGCAFIDFGAGATSLSIFKEGKLRYMVVIPFGGATITKDVSELNLVEKDAEEHKIMYGKIDEPKDSNLSKSSTDKTTEKNLDFSKLLHVIEMRVQEIVENIEAQINASGYKDKLGAGLIITGGASQLKNLDLYLEKKLGMSVRKASAKRTYVNNFPELANDPSYTQALGLLLYGKVNCEEQVVKEVVGEGVDNKEVKRKKAKAEQPNKRNAGDKIKDMFGGLGGLFAGMFDEEEDN